HGADRELAVHDDERSTTSGGSIDEQAHAPARCGMDIREHEYSVVVSLGRDEILRILDGIDHAHRDVCDRHRLAGCTDDLSGYFHPRWQGRCVDGRLDRAVVAATHEDKSDE